MIRTRVGYAGGATSDPTYHRIGDHSEAIQIEFDPAQVSYSQLLRVFWSSHAPAEKPFARQYASLIFYYSEEQRELAFETKRHLEATLGQEVLTEIVPFSAFTRAEDYHQKHHLQETPGTLAELSAIYPSVDDLVDSTLAARINGFVGGHGTIAEVERAMDALGLSPETRQRLLNQLQESRR